MAIFRSIVFTAALAGLISGGFATVLHMVGTARLIAHAEVFEKAAEETPAGTAIATAGGLALLFLTRRALWAVAGIALLLLPHLIGAPQPAEYKSAAPAELAHQFIVAAMITSLLFWLVLGVVTGTLFNRFRQ